MPEWYLNCPDIFPGDDFYLTGFWELSSCRQFGDVIGPIPWNLAVEYALWHRLDRDMTNVFVAVIRSMDETYLEWLREDQKRQTETTRRQMRSSAKRGRK